MPRGGFGGTGGFRGGYGMRRTGYPLIGGMGGAGMGSPLMTGIMAGGLGYVLGSNRNQNSGQQTGQPVAMYPPQMYPQQMYPPQYSYPPSPAAQGAGGDDGTLAQLKLLGQLHDSGTLTDEEFATEKQRILGGA